MPSSPRTDSLPPGLAAAILDVTHALIVVLDREGRIVAVNRAVERATGYGAGDLEGRRVWDFLLVKSEVGAVRAVFERLCSGDFPNEFENYWVRRDGSRLRIAWSNTALPEEDGQIAFVIGTGIDVTEQRHAEAQHAEALARAHSILDAAVDPIITIDESGTVESVNRALTRVFGYAPEEVVGENVSMLMPSPYREQHDEYLKRYLETGHRKIIGIGREVVGRRSDGTRFPMDLAVSEVSLGDRRLFTGVVRDLTERKHAEERERRAEARARAAEELASIGTLAAGISHEIGSPLNVVQGYAEMIAESAEEEATRKRAGVILEQVRRVTGLIQSLLDVARPHEPQRLPVDVDEVLDRSVTFLQEKLRGLGIKVDRDYEPVPAVVGDADKLQQLFLNLFLNAADAMPDGGSLRLSLRRRDGSIELRVRDTGAGIQPDAVRHLFEPFYTTKARGRGNGLGLAVCKGIVTSHGGTIDVLSEPGRGTEFIIAFPAVSIGAVSS